MTNDEIERATARIEAMIEQHPEVAPERIRQELLRLRLQAGSFRSKRAKILKTADALNEAASDFAACKKGCGECCRMPTLIYEHEAAEMARASDRVIAKVPFRPRESVIQVMARHYGTPCPFLIDESCSIYADRPHVCRVHLSFNDDASACSSSQRIDQRAPVVMYNADLIEVPYNNIVLNYAPAEPWGCIQEFFP